MNKFIPYILIIAIGLLSGACSPTNKLTMGATQPAPVTISPNIKTIGIINRSLPSEGNKTIDKIDKILSLEGLNLDREGADAAIAALYTELSRNDRFDRVVVMDSVELVKKGLSVFPATLDWESVETLCNIYDVDALFSLEFYDTDTKADVQITTVSVPNDIGIKASVPGHRVSLRTTIKNGWRIYDPQTREVLDKFVSRGQITSVGQGINPVRAIEAIIGRKEAVIQESKYIGTSYGLRLRPFNRRVSRDYYVRGTENFKVGQRRAQTGDWQGAANLWEQETTHPDSKVAGRACYNMAIINEINGDLETAIDWASKSYTDYNNKLALQYLNILKNRVSKRRKLQQQLSR